MEKNNINPLVSIIIPAYNVEKYVIDTINSVLDQTYQNIELIIVDDCSNDNTLEKLRSIVTTRHLLIPPQTKNSGAAAARNIGYTHSKGTFIKFLDGDDLVNPEMIEEQVKLALKNPNSIVSGKWGRFHHNDTNTFKLSPEECWKTLPSVDWICNSWKNAQSMTNPGIFLIPRRIIDTAGLWDEHLSLIDDMEYFTRTILTAENVLFCPQAVLFYRSGISGSLSSTKTSKGFESSFLAIEKATEALLKKRNDEEAQLSCANIWQHFIYDVYPIHQHLVAKAHEHLIKLVKPSISFPAGGISKLVLPFFGWKLTKRLQLIKKSVRPNVHSI